jgi:hypothetical protein
MNCKQKSPARVQGSHGPARAVIGGKFIQLACQVEHMAAPTNLAAIVRKTLANRTPSTHSN